MKVNELWVLKMIAAALVGGCLLSGGLPLSANAQVSISADIQINSPSDFYQPLTTFGTWINVAPYGRCWRPANVASDWRPYSTGHWEWTDVGWYWVSDEPWGWACYHYGGWELDPTYGWVWAPGTEWSPAWVTWREAPDYVGWAPCGPGGVALADSAFVFVDVHHFHDRLQPRELVFNNHDVFRRSRVVGGFRRETRDFDGGRRQIAFNRGPAIEPIQRATGAKFTAKPARELVRETRVSETDRRGVGEHRKEQAGEANRTAGNPAATERDQKRIYREAPSQPAPTGRQEQRIYREAPAPQPAPRTSEVPGETPKRQAVPRAQIPPQAPQPTPLTPREVPRRQPLPEASTPRVTQEQPRQVLPPNAVERGRSETQPPQRREQPPAAPRAVPAPSQRPSPPPEKPSGPKDKDHQGD